jgi:hypothetical protein
LGAHENEIEGWGQKKTCLVGVRTWVQTPALPREKGKERRGREERREDKGEGRKEREKERDYVDMNRY